MDIQAFWILAITNYTEMNIIRQDPCTIFKYFLQEGFLEGKLLSQKGMCNLCHDKCWLTACHEGDNNLHSQWGFLNQEKEAEWMSFHSLHYPRLSTHSLDERGNSCCFIDERERERESANTPFLAEYGWELCLCDWTNIHMVQLHQREDIYPGHSLTGERGKHHFGSFSETLSERQSDYSDGLLR